MLSNAGLSKEFWAEAVNTACYLVNRSPSTTIECKTPEEVWSGSPTSYTDLRVFGCPAYAHVNEGKLEPRAKKCIFLGYADVVKGFRLWYSDSKSSKFIISRDVTFDESAMLNPKRECLDTEKDHGVREKVELEIKASENIQEDVPGQVDEEEVQHPEEEDAPQEQQYNLARTREKWQIRPPERYGYADLVAYALSVVEDIEVHELCIYHESITSGESAQ